MAVEKAGYQDYNVYAQDHEYVSVAGVVQLPVAGRTSASRLIRLHGGYGKRVITFRADRHGRPPVIPTPANLSGDTLLSTSVTPMLPRPNEQAGGYDWSVKGQYVFAQNTVRVPGTDNLPTGAFPFSLPIQTAVSSALIAEAGSSSPSVLSTLVDYDTGSWIWPFTDLNPVFFTTELLT